MIDRRTSKVRFAGFELDLYSYELFAGDEKIQLPQQAIQVLALLAARPKELVTRGEIQAALWPDRLVDFEAGINTSIRKIRRALGDNASKPTIIETVPKRGYRFLLSTQNVSQSPKLNSFFTKQMTAAIGAALSILFVGIVLLGSTNTPPSSAQMAGNATDLNSPGYQSFLFGSHAMKTGAYKKAQRYFQDAIDKDDRFAAAYVGLAHSKIFTRSGDFSAVGEAQNILDRALAIDPDLAIAHHLNARLALYYWRDHERAKTEIERALALSNNDPDVLTTAAYFYTITGDASAALNAISRAHEISPLSPALNADYGWVHYKARNWDDAERLCKTSVELNPRSTFALECVIHINHSQGDAAEAADYGTRLMKLRGASQKEIASVRAISNANDRELAFWSWLAKWYERNGPVDQSAKYAITLSMMGELDDAADALDAAFEKNGEPLLSFIAVDPRVDELRRHKDYARFAELSRTPIPQLP